MAKYFVISLIAAVVLAQLCDSKPAYQVLQQKPGFVAVYIVNGNEALADVNPILAEAFGEHPISARNIKDDSESSFGPTLPAVPGLPAGLPSTKSIEDASKSVPGADSSAGMIPDAPTIPMPELPKN